MPRVKRGVTTHRRHKKILKLAKGYVGSKSKLYPGSQSTGYEIGRLCLCPPQT